MSSPPFDFRNVRESVVAVPPLARDAGGEINIAENEKIIRHIEAGGVHALLYGGNAVFYHLQNRQLARTLEFLAQCPAETTAVIPSIGPCFGQAMDQADVYRDHDFATVMLLPLRDVQDPDGIATGIRLLAEKIGRPLVLYLKYAHWLDAERIVKLDRDGVISWIKYAVVLDDPADDPELSALVDAFPKDRIISGIGEQPAIVHTLDFGVGGFTSGCVCVDPSSSQAMRDALRRGDREQAESYRRHFVPLEDLRNEISPIRVLHAAVRLAGIAETGPLPPWLSNISATDEARVQQAVSTLKRE
ncbi:MAG: dihydrodipicolinate synthase family protein [Planctomycetota bacterium]